MIKYFDCIATMKQDGVPIPNQIIWDTGQVFEVDKVIDCRKKASTKGGGAGLRYLVKIKGKERYLFLNEYKWFVELD